MEKYVAEKIQIAGKSLKVIYDYKSFLAKENTCAVMGRSEDLFIAVGKIGVTPTFFFKDNKEKVFFWQCIEQGIKTENIEGKILWY